MKDFLSPIATLLVAASISGSVAAEEDDSSSLGNLAAVMMTISKSVENPESLSESDWTDQLKCTGDMNSANPTLADETTCGSTMDADGTACLWCDATQTIGQGLCVSPSQKTMIGQYWDQLCAASSSNNDTPDVQPEPAVTTPPPTPNPTPSPTTKPTEATPDPDDNVPDNMKCSMNGQSPITDQATCEAKLDTSAGASGNCAWCKVPFLGGSCITTSMHNQMSWVCQSEEKAGNLRGDNNNNGGFKDLDPSCLGDQDSCGSRTDSSGNACMWCSASDVFGICATTSQKDYMGEYMDCKVPTVVKGSSMAVE